MQSDIQYTAQKPSPTLDLHIYNGVKPNSYTYYEDDGMTYQFESGQYYQRNINFEPGNKTIILTKPEGNYPSKFTTLRLIFHSFDDTMTIRCDGKEYSLKLRSASERTVEIPAGSGPVKITY